MIIEVSWLSEKAPPPMVVTEFGIVSVVSWLPAKELSVMVVTEFGIVSEVS